MINVDKPWPEWSGGPEAYKGSSVHALYMWPKWMRSDPEYGREKAMCGERAANLYTEDDSRVTCGRCRKML